MSCWVRLSKAGARSIETNQPISSLRLLILIPLGPTAEAGSSHSKVTSDSAGSSQTFLTSASAGIISLTFCRTVASSARISGWGLTITLRLTFFAIFTVSDWPAPPNASGCLVMIAIEPASTSTS